MRPGVLYRLTLKPSSMSLYQTHSWPTTATTQNPPPTSPHGGSAHLAGRIRICCQKASSAGSIAVSPLVISDRNLSSLIGCHMPTPFATKRRTSAAGRHPPAGGHQESNHAAPSG